MPSSHLPISVHWDYYDQVWRHGDVYGAEEMARLCRNAKAAGVTSLNFRVEGAGMSWVPTSARPVFDRYEAGRCADLGDFSRLPATSVQHDERRRTAAIFGRTYAQLGDPLAVAVNAAREAGIRLNIYICPLDQFWPGVSGTLVENAAERCIASRDGSRKLPVASLAFRENREWLLAYYREVFERDFADVVVYPNSHAWYSYPLDTPDDWFGFETPAVDDYLAATGVDVRLDPFDVDDYYRHYGSYWTLLLRELSELARERQRRLVVGMDMGPWQVYLPWAAGRPRCTWRWRNEWEKWTSWGNVDLCVGHQVNMWEYEGWPANQLPYMPGEPGRAPYEVVRDMFGPADQRQFQLWAFLTMHKDRAQSELTKALAGSKSSSCDGLMIREAMDFEFDVGWDLLTRSLAVLNAAGSR